MLLQNAVQIFFFSIPPDYAYLFTSLASLFFSLSPIQDYAKLNCHVLRLKWQTSHIMSSTTSQIIIKAWNNKSKFAWFVSSRALQCVWTFKVTIRKQKWSQECKPYVDFEMIIIKKHHRKELAVMNNIQNRHTSSISSWWNSTGKIYGIYFYLSLITPPLLLREGHKVNVETSGF